MIEGVFTFLLEKCVVFFYPYIFTIFDFGVRKYVWLKNLSFFQPPATKYADILDTDHWTYNGTLFVTDMDTSYRKYSMIHQYNGNIPTDDEPASGCDTAFATRVDQLAILKNDNEYIFRVSIPNIKPDMDFSCIEKSKVSFLYVEFSNKNTVIAFDIPSEMMHVGNELFSPAFIYRELDLIGQTSLFNSDYQLIIVDDQLESIRIHSKQYILIEKNTYSVRWISDMESSDSITPLKTIPDIDIQ